MPATTIFPPILFVGVSCSEIIGSNSGTPFAKDMKRDYQKKFRIIIQNKVYAHTGFVCQHPALPVDFSVYYTPFGDYFDTQSVLIKKSAMPEHGEEDWQSWIVTCDYSADQEKKEPKKRDSSEPQSDPPEVHWETEVVQKAMPLDLNGNAFTNSSYVPYKPAPTIEMVRPILVFSRNEYVFGPQQIDTYAFASNLFTFLGRDQGYVRCDPPVAQKMFKGNLQFYKVTYRIKFGASFPLANKVFIREWNGFPGAGITPLWQINQEQQLYEWMDVIDMLDEGFLKLADIDESSSDPNAKPKPITRNGRQLSQPVLLNGMGQELKMINGKPDPTKGPVYNRFQVAKYTDLNALLTWLPYPFTP